jgi:hypothetical protein
VAVALLILGSHLRGAPRPALGILGVLAVGWAVCAVLNAESWHAAHLTGERTLSAMRQAEARFPPGATVLVDTLDTEDGAYVFRNGLPEAARLRGLRADLTWRRDTAAAIGPEAGGRLGRDLFEIGANRAGGAIDWTACERSLFRQGPDAPPAAAEGGEAGAAAWLLARPCPRRGLLRGTLFWRTDRGRPFTTTRQRSFRLPAGSAVPVRLPAVSAMSAMSAAGPPPDLRVDVEGAGAAACLQPVRLRPLPAGCPPGPVR